MSTSSLTKLKSLIKSSKKSSRKVLTMVNRTKVKAEISQLTFLVLTLQNLSLSDTYVQPLSEMPCPISSARWATTPSRSTTWVTGASNSVSSWLLTRNGATRKPLKLTQSMNSCNSTFALMPKSKTTQPWMKKVAFGSRNWKMAIQKQQNYGNGSVTKVSLNLTVSMNCSALNLIA